MKFESIESALYGLYNLSRQSVCKAQDYKSLDDILSTVPKDEVLFKIALARKVIHKIESICDPTQLAILRFRFGYTDRFGDDESIRTVSCIAYEKHPIVGKSIAYDWRGDTIRDRELLCIKVIMRWLGIERRMAHYILADARNNLAPHMAEFVNTEYALAFQIENILNKESLLS